MKFWVPQAGEPDDSFERISFVVFGDGEADARDEMYIVAQRYPDSLNNDNFKEALR